MIRYKFCGKVDNDTIQKFYRKYRIDCFVHVSEKEGLPVAIMEAESAGIPVVATSAGGTKETIFGNGRLLPVECDAGDVAGAIKSIIAASPDKKRQMRCSSRSIWESKFDAAKNAKCFITEINKNKQDVANIIFITEGYPFDSRELTFLKSELIEMVDAFDRVIIIPRIQKSITNEMKSEAAKRIADDLGKIGSDNIFVIPYVDIWGIAGVIKYICQYSLDTNTEIERRSILNSGGKYAIRYWESMKYYALARKFNKWFSNACDKEKINIRESIVYTFWNLQPTLGICMDRKRLGANYVITRAHGYDWQDEQWEKSLRKPFAETIDNNIDRIFFVSKTGMEQYIQRYGRIYDASKYSFGFLGSADFGIPPVESAYSDERHYVVSCGSLIPLKRIKMIIDALKILSDECPDMEIEWIHFGDGPLRQELEDYANIQFSVEN